MDGAPILCVDFDGVIHSYTSKWQGVEIISDPPVPGALKWLAEATDFFEVHIYSSRSKETRGINAMKAWFFRHIQLADDLYPEEKAKLSGILFAYEKPAAFLTIDDRALTFDGDWSKLNPTVLQRFKPWNKK